MATPACTQYRPRRPETTPLYRLVETHLDGVRSEWEERFEGRYGFWRGIADTVVAAYLDCGILENGFARVRCGACRAEFLVAFSCKGRGLCPSCASKRAAGLAAFLREEVLADVGHAQWVFSIPKMLRPYFLHRPLLGRLCQAAYQTAREIIGAAGSAGAVVAPPPPVIPVTDAEALRRRWAQLIRRIFEADPLVCPRCGEGMRIIAFLTEPRVIDKIFKHFAPAHRAHRRRGGVTAGARSISGTKPPRPSLLVPANAIRRPSTVLTTPSAAVNLDRMKKQILSNES